MQLLRASDVLILIWPDLKRRPKITASLFPVLFVRLLDGRSGALADDIKVIMVKPGNTHPLNGSRKYHDCLTSCPYSLRLGCFQNRENVL